ncbi:tumor necrosis factor ligand superfamily member 6 isoform X1 [Oryzias melastigma]|uniref:tumor necrosis factor ligand superfamily member 6 isoform X1 n=1 Tax=Oryzias melastigma TaxID=30732 RepID=UPI000CF7EFEB|nr:tumor necrosis factor ligand superfamily member 6 isoform X1 [Oryzias melastigma]
MARNEEKQQGRLNRLWLQKERQEGRLKDVHERRPKLSSLNSASSVKKWIPSINNEIEYLLQQSQLTHYPERKIEEFQLRIEALQKEHKSFIAKLRSLDPSCKQKPWTLRAYTKRRADTRTSPSTALGFEAYQILNLREKVKDMEKVEPQEAAEFSAPLKQTGYLKSGLELKEEDESSRPAAHVLGRIQNYGSEKTLRWEPKTGQAFTSGGVVYRFQDGSLQVNETGFFQIYSRVEFIFRKCSPTTSFEHLVFKKQAKKPSPTTLMVARRVGFCHPPEQPLTIESYLGSAHHLEQGDRVFVNVSQPNILSHSHYGNFFGLYKI